MTALEAATQCHANFARAASSIARAELAEPCVVAGNAAGTRQWGSCSLVTGDPDRRATSSRWNLQGRCKRPCSGGAAAAAMIATWKGEVDPVRIGLGSPSSLPDKLKARRSITAKQKRRQMFQVKFNNIDPGKPAAEVSQT